VRGLLLLLLFSIVSLLVAKEREENIVSDLDRVDVKKTLRWGDEGEVDGVGRDPNGPTSHDGRLEIGLDFGNILIPALSFDGAEVTKEHASEDGVPHCLVDEDLRSDSDGLGSGELGIEESIEEVTRRSVEEETEGTQTNGAHGVVRGAIVVDELLSEDITGGEADEGSAHLGKERLSLEDGVVSGPKSHCWMLLNITRSEWMRCNLHWI